MAGNTSHPWAVIGGVAGVVLFEAGFALTQISFSGVTVAQWNALCGTGLVQLSPLASAHAAGECMLVAGAYHATSWLIRCGLGLLGYSLLLLATRRFGKRLKS